MGWLARQFGLACDNVARFEVVSANGEILHASQSQNPDLFRGLRGGGGNFGIVTEFEFRLHPAGHRRPVLPPGRRAAGAAPMARPDHWRAAPGNADRLGRRRRLLPALRGGTAPAAERTQELTYLQLQAIDGIPQAPCQRRYWKGHYLREFGDEAIGAFVLTRARTECGAPTALARWPGSPR
jgi:FAD/FMN-containing dehydrogenase